jgi:hypothetical protein
MQGCLDVAVIAQIQDRQAVAPGDILRCSRGGGVKLLWRSGASRAEGFSSKRIDRNSDDPLEEKALW